ncbi:MAG: DEAD/DEAH box helicase [Bacilli bacterium]|nr:DEAD/DEAH box helicase [Bacilli bacterium]
MTFKELGLSDIILKALIELNHNEPTLIQELAIPHVMQKKDVLGCAQTGTGKTAAFVLPIIQSLIMNERNTYRNIKVLVLSPTRELAIQTRDNFRKYGKYTNLKCSVVLGGVNQRSQVKVLQKGIDILVATPGRLLDLINQNIVKLNSVNTLVLDEADTMLDMGFIHDIRKIIACVPKARQTLMFSATMPKAIRSLANEFLKNPILIEANTESLTVDKINQSVYFVYSRNKANLLLEILHKEEITSTLIFTRTKHKANKLADILEKNNLCNEVIHGNKSQSARVSALNNFKSGRSKVLIATDIAARGIDIIELSHVINYELPNLAESYVHRIGRTGRAGCGGSAISFCDQSERKYLYTIQRLIKQSIMVIEDHNYPMEQIVVKEQNKRNFSKRGYQNNNNRKYKKNKYIKSN